MAGLRVKGFRFFFYQGFKALAIRMADLVLGFLGAQIPDLSRKAVLTSFDFIFARTGAAPAFGVHHALKVHVVSGFTLPPPPPQKRGSMWT